MMVHVGFVRQKRKRALSPTRAASSAERARRELLGIPFGRARQAPGHGENIRVLRWMIDRIAGEARARSTWLGYLPEREGIDLSGLPLTDRDFHELFAIDPDAWLAETERHQKLLARFGSRMPDVLPDEHAALVARIQAARQVASALAPSREESDRATAIRSSRADSS